MRRYGFRAAMLSTWRANVLQTASSLSRVGLGVIASGVLAGFGGCLAFLQRRQLHPGPPGFG